jgi:hypothetical protein
MAAKFFGEFLLEKGILDRDALDRAVAVQQGTNLMLGELAVSERMLTKEQALSINLRQQVQNKRFGEIAIELGLLKEEKISLLLDLQKEKCKYLGQILVEQRILSDAQLKLELELHQNALDEAYQALSMIMNNHPLEPYLDGLVELTDRLFVRILHKKTKFSQLVDPSQVPYDYDATCQIRIGPSQSIVVTMATNADTAIRIASGFTLQAIDECDLEFSVDALGEFLNIVMGHYIEEKQPHMDWERSVVQLNVSIEETSEKVVHSVIAQIDTQIGPVFLLVAE